MANVNISASYLNRLSPFQVPVLVLFPMQCEYAINKDHYVNLVLLEHVGFAH